MKIKLNQIKIKDLAIGFQDNQDLGVVAYNSKLDIRPPYQREFVYNSEQENSVINSIMNGFPLNVMYWAKTSRGYEIIDGQQRTLSICHYFNNEKAWESNNGPKYFQSLTKDEQDKFLNYELTIYICDGTDSEKLKWFEIINIAGEKLTNQELRNAVYSGTWTNEAKKYFSKMNGPGINISKHLTNVSPVRQELLELAIKWISYNENCSIEEYMSKHQNDKDAEEIWTYFQNIINWVNITFIKTRKEMKFVNWGKLYYEHSDKKLNPKYLEAEIFKLMQDDEIENKRGIYEYVLTSNTKYLNLRSFTDSQKRTMYEKQNGICKKCNKHFLFEEMEGDHITPWIRGGKTEINNLQMLCKECNRRKSDK